MPGSLGIRLIAVTTLVVVGAGCATSPTNLSARPEFYRESSADIVNRAPSSLSVPQEAATGSQIDELQMRAKADFHFTLAETHSLDGNSARAVEEYKHTLVYDPNSTMVRLRLAHEYVKQGLVSEALEQARVALEIDPNLVDAHMLLGGLYSALRMYKEAMHSYRSVQILDSKNLEAPMFIGAIYAEQKKYPEALEQFESLAKNPENENPHLAWYYVGRIHMESSKADSKAKAEKAFRAALAAKPGFSDALLALGKMMEDRNRSEAKTFYARYQEQHGPDVGVAEALGRIYMEDEDFDKAFEQFEIIEASDEENLNVKVKMAFILIEKKKFQDAIVKLEDILARAPDSDKIRFYLGAVYEEIKDYKGAITHFNKIQPGSSYHAEAVVHAAYLNKVIGNYDEAVRIVEQGIQTQPDHAQFYALYASFLDDQKKWSRGVEMLSSAVTKFPDNAQLHFFLGSMFDRVGKTEETVKSMRRVLEIEKDHVQALNYLAYTYADKDLDLDEAEKLARRALELQPDDGYILDTLGWVLFKKGKTPEAVRILEAAYKAQPTESIIAEHLGDAYHKQQLPEKAKQMYQRAMEAETDESNQKKIRNKIVSVERQQESIALPTTKTSPRLPASER